MVARGTEADDGLMTALLLQPIARPLDEKLELLAATPVGARRTRSEFEDLGRAFEVAQVSPGTVLQRAGVRVRWWGVIAAGLADLSIDGVVIGQLRPGQAFGAACITGRRPSPVTVAASTPLTVLLLDGRRLRHMLDRFPDLAATPDPADREWRDATLGLFWTGSVNSRLGPAARGANRASRLFPEDYAGGARTGTRNGWGL